MARLLHSSVDDARPCSYLPGIDATLEHWILMGVLPEEVDEMLDHGWRHFGAGWFRPVCNDCTACLSTRILVNEFSPSRSQRRVQRLAAGLRFEIGFPVLDVEHLELFNVWHEQRVRARGWEPVVLDAKDYFVQFAHHTAAGREVAYYDDNADGRLVMVAICDETPRAWNAVFCFYDPAYAHISPGLANILNLIDLAKASGKRFVHLGYCVEDCQSLRYKAAFHPQEVLVGWPDLDQIPNWVRAK
jgi:arginyl-tRNA--protein-N-Asp/Glu arginylyltransferase